MMKSGTTTNPVLLFLGSLIFVLLMTASSIFIFLMGIQKGMEISAPGIASNPTRADIPATARHFPGILPQAMTATPKARVQERMKITAEKLVRIFNQEVKRGSADVDIQVSSATLTTDGVSLQGMIDGLGFVGPVEILGIPEVKEGKLIFRLGKAKMVGNEIPKELYPFIEAEINQYLEEWMWGFDVIRVYMGVGELTLDVIGW